MRTYSMRVVFGVLKPELVSAIRDSRFGGA